MYCAPCGYIVMVLQISLLAQRTAISELNSLAVGVLSSLCCLQDAPSGGPLQKSLSSFTPLEAALNHPWSKLRARFTHKLVYALRGRHLPSLARQQQVLTDPLAYMEQLPGMRRWPKIRCNLTHHVRSCTRA